MEEHNRLSRYLSPINVWALSFGCAVGWGAFVMPGTTFLPAAGPWGTALGIGIGAVVMLIIGMNYHYLMNKYPDAGGTLTYTSEIFVYDHGFLSAWFILLVYIAIIWANDTALTLIARNLLGSAFQFGFHYTLLGYDVYFGEVLLSMAAILIFGLLCIHGKRLTVHIQTVLAIALFGGVVAGAGFEVRWCPGVSSFCAGAAALGTELVSGSEVMTVIPYSSPELGQLLDRAGTKIVMKSGRNAGKLKALLREKGLLGSTAAVINVGLEGEKLLFGEDIPEEPGYFALFIIKDSI